MERIARDLPTFNVGQPQTAAADLRTLLADRKTINLLAKFTFEITSMYSMHEPYVPSLPLHWLIHDSVRRSGSANSSAKGVDRIRDDDVPACL
ncbi:hypothetical protein LshimejAT787_1901670 [Lyophyllum shimeji]|uniref:Uncharacterized protein n=1 Tax=Lyophyllum shimeji TaxID=47721 RepID=A0A9P3Q106_LYOSH|nr:hypothetical protein LshimejAT787_1901670 [Lyophyllum shimeji]